MKAYVSVECSKCRRVGDEYEHIYCQRCMNEKDKELHEQVEQIKRLYNEIKELEHKVSYLQKEKK